MTLPSDNSTTRWREGGRDSSPEAYTDPFSEVYTDPFSTLKGRGTIGPWSVQANTEAGTGREVRRNGLTLFSNNEEAPGVSLSASFRRL